MENEEKLRRLLNETQPIFVFISPHLKGGNGEELASELFKIEAGADICYNTTATIPGSDIMKRHELLGTNQSALCNTCNAHFLVYFYDE